MKRAGVINDRISHAIASLGHTDMLCICDAGFPIPQEVTRIDVAVAINLPRFLDTLKAILSDMVVEKAIVAQEIKEYNPSTLDEIKKTLGSVPVEFVSHDDLKQLSHKAKAVVRTGECTPYSNIILISTVDEALWYSK